MLHRQHQTPRCHTDTQTGTDTAGHADTHTATVTQDTDPVVTKAGTVLAYATVGTDSLVPRSGTSSASSPQVKVRSLIQHTYDVPALDCDNRHKQVLTPPDMLIPVPQKGTAPAYAVPGTDTAQAVVDTESAYTSQPGTSPTALNRATSWV